MTERVEQIAANPNPAERRLRFALLEWLRPVQSVAPAATVQILRLAQTAEELHEGGGVSLIAAGAPELEDEDDHSRLLPMSLPPELTLPAPWALVSWRFESDPPRMIGHVVCFGRTPEELLEWDAAAQGKWWGKPDGVDLNTWILGFGSDTSA